MSYSGDYLDKWADFHKVNSSVFAVVRNCLEDAEASHPDKKLKFRKVILTNTPDYIDVEAYKEFTIGQNTSLLKCRIKVVTEGLVKK